jgi:hypothetical protein
MTKLEIKIRELEKLIREKSRKDYKHRGTNWGDIMYLMNKRLAALKRVNKAAKRWGSRDVMPEVLAETAPQFLKEE